MICALFQCTSLRAFYALFRYILYFSSVCLGVLFCVFLCFGCAFFLYVFVLCALLHCILCLASVCFVPCIGVFCALFLVFCALFCCVLCLVLVYFVLIFRATVLIEQRQNKRALDDFQVGLYSCFCIRLSFPVFLCVKYFPFYVSYYLFLSISVC